MLCDLQLLTQNERDTKEDFFSELNHVSIPKGITENIGIFIRPFRLDFFFKGMLMVKLQKSQTRIKKQSYRASLVAKWLRIHLPMQGTWVRALVREDPTRHRATKPAGHNY